MLGVFTRLAKGAKTIEEGVLKETGASQVPYTARHALSGGNGRGMLSGAGQAFMMHPIFGSLTCWCAPPLVIFVSVSCSHREE